MSDVHLFKAAMFDDSDVWCESTENASGTNKLADCTCLACLLACAEYGSDARHRYEVLREQGAKP